MTVLQLGLHKRSDAVSLLTWFSTLLHFSSIRQHRMRTLAGKNGWFSENVVLVREVCEYSV